MDIVNYYENHFFFLNHFINERVVFRFEKMNDTSVIVNLLL